MMRLTRRAILGTGPATLLGAAMPRIAGAAPTADNWIEAVDAAMRESIDAGASPGASIAVSQGGHMLFRRDYGLANLETRTPVDAESVFRIGSITKQFVAAAVVKLAASSIMDLDGPASQYLPALETFAPFSLRELMTHTAGLTDSEEASCAPVVNEEPLQGGAGWQPTPPVEFDFEPGSAWLYSNANYQMLGAILQQITGKPLGQAVADLITRPLGLNSLTFDTAGSVVQGRASGYAALDEPGAFANAFIEIEATGGAGAMRAQIEDLCLWHHHLFSNRVFGQTWVDQMLQPGRLRDGRLSGENRFSPNDANYGDTQYGMGLLIAPPSPQGRIATHYGYVTGFSACLESFVDHQLTLAVLCNSDLGPNLPFRGIRRAIREAALSA